MAMSIIGMVIEKSIEERKLTNFTTSAKARNYLTEVITKMKEHFNAKQNINEKIIKIKMTKNILWTD